MCKQCGDPLEIAGSGIYAACKVGNAIDIHKWSRVVLGPRVEPPEELHCTVAYSTKHFDVTRVPDFKPIKLGKNDGRRIGRLGDMIVLFLDEVEARPVKKIWKAFIDQGASWDFPSYVCHISLAKYSNLSDGELAGLTAYQGPILLLPPYIDGLGDEEFEVEETAALVTKREVIKKIKALIVKFEKTTSDRVADKLKKQIYDELEKHNIKREEVGLKPLKGKKATKTGAMTRDSMILEIKGWINRFERTSSDSVADRLKKQIHDAMEKYNITRSEVGLPEKKTKTEKKSVTKTSPLQSTMPLKRLPLIPLDRAAHGSKSVKLAYLKELWNILNDEKFAGQMKLPKLDLLKSMNIERGRLKGLGVWMQGKRRLAINPNVFNSEAQLYETLLHEMCHQAVSEVTKLGYREGQAGHGPVWASWMVKVGLNPKRFDDSDITEFMTPSQKAEYEHKQEIKNKAVASEQRITPSVGTPAKWFDSNNKIWKAGLISVPHDKAGKRWTFVGVNDAPGRWMIVPANMFYAVDEATAAMLRSRLSDRVDDLRAYKENKTRIRQERKMIRDMFR